MSVGRSASQSRKLKENLEASEEEVKALQETLKKHEDPKLLTSEEREAAKAEISKAYDKLRLALGGTAPSEFRLATDRAISALERMSSQGSIRSRDSQDSSRSRQALLAAEKARLEVEKRAKKEEAERLLHIKELEAREAARRAQHELEVMRLKGDLEQQSIEAGIEQRRVEISAIQEAEESYSDNSSIRSVPEKEIVDDKNTMSELLQAINRSADYGRLPVPEPPVFSGDPLQFPQWKAAFQCLIESRNVPPRERIYFLQRFLSGDAKVCVEGLFLLSSEEAYKRAWELLEKRYGNQFSICEAFRRRLHNWPTIDGSNHKKLREFGDLLTQCQIAMESNPGLSILNDYQENRKLLTKLPAWVRRKWMDKVADVDLASYPKFHVFAQFVAKMADRVNHPVFLESGNEKPQRRSRTLQTAAKEEPFRQAVKGCQYCKMANHHLKNCRKFRGISRHERSNFIKEAKLCFGCLELGHRSKDCVRRAECDICHKRHPTCLHGDHGQQATAPTQDNSSQGATTQNFSGSFQEQLLSPQTTQAVTMTTRMEGSGSLSSPIVPVYLSTEKNLSEEKLVYALLDTQSDTTFVLEDVVADLPYTDFSPAKLQVNTMTSSSVISCKRFKGLRVRGMHSKQSIPLPEAYSRTFIPVDKEHIPTCSTANQWPHLNFLKDKIPPLLDCEVGLLIGYNCPSALAPLEVTLGKTSEPFAQRTPLGWSIVGRISAREDAQDNPSGVSFVHRTTSKDVTCADIIKTLDTDFRDIQTEQLVSQDDMKFIQILSEGIKQDPDGYYEMPLPFRDGQPTLPNNRGLAMKRLNQLKRRFIRDRDYHTQYQEFVASIIARGEAELVEKPDQALWYIPHHGVFHPKKRKLRVVFDCSAEWDGSSLNQHLLQGPDPINSLVGVLCRFREKPIAVTGDIERMFHQFRVKGEDRAYLSFLWWENGDVTKEVMTYQMKVHLFGATSSPGCCIFGLQALARQHGPPHEDVIHFVTRNFYVDDGIHSCNTVQEAVHLVDKTRQTLAKGNIRLHKFSSNSRQVMSTIPESEWAQDATQMALDKHNPLTEGVLGVQWSVEGDHLCFRITVSEKPLTRRGVLSTVASVFDPLGCLAPFTLLGKKILQEMCRDGCKWDDPLSESLKPRWEQWLRDLPLLEELKVPRCFQPFSFDKCSQVELHHFSDGSSAGYGQCSYWRAVDSDGTVTCAFVMGKARVAPSKIVTIPRMELVAATVSAKVAKFLQDQLTFPNMVHYFWTDSTVVLDYIQNDAKRFQVFVANRVQQIKNLSDTSSWYHVPGPQNPADHASRGLTAADLLTSNWLSGPSFLSEQRLVLPERASPNLLPDDPELKRQVHATSRSSGILDRLERFSSWTLMIRVVARVKGLARASNCDPTEEDRGRAELCVLRMTQRESFSQEMTLLSQGKTLPRGNRLESLDPFLDSDGIMRVGGRLRRSSMPPHVKHPLILPKTGHVVSLLIGHCHAATAHQGRGYTINALRSRGYWILGCSRAVSSWISRCVTCRKLRSKPLGQKMANLPPVRIEDTSPFTYCGIDCFGPFLVRDLRKEMKKYALMVTCMASRAVHIELLEDLSTDAFIIGLRCVIALRGPIRSLYCDQGTNFVGANTEFGKAFETSSPALKEFLSRNHCDFVFNSPHSSHMGGVWERQIRSTRSILASTLDQHKGRIDTATLRAFLYEAMAIINSRPLTVQDINDPMGSGPLCPNNVLTGKVNVVAPPPGNFCEQDMLLRKRWRKMQRMLEEFWRKWSKAYVLQLQDRSKWRNRQLNIAVGDIVIIADEVARGAWKMGRVLKAEPSSDGLVRKVQIIVGDHQLSEKGKPFRAPTVLERPVHKLVVILHNSEYSAQSADGIK